MNDNQSPKGYVDINNSLDVDFEPEETTNLSSITKRVENQEIIDPDEVEREVRQELARTPDHEIDYRLLRSNLKSLISQQMLTVDNLTSLAETSESPRLYEVLAMVMKTALESHRELIELHKDRKKLNEDMTKSENSNNVTNNNLIMTTNDLLKLLNTQNPDENDNEQD